MAMTATFSRSNRSSRFIPYDNFKPNVRPYGPEVVPDIKWRDWRLRELRQDLRETYPEMWPPIVPALRARATEEINQQRANDSVRHRDFKPRSLADLNGYRATRLQFRSLQDINRRVHRARLATRPREEYREEEYDKLPPFFFEELSSDLFARVWEFATDTFGHKDWAFLVNDRDWTAYWLNKLPAEFVRSASVVARGDRFRGGKAGHDEHGYEYLFLEQHNRVYLCTAIVAKLLQENCFDALLFGATAEQKKTLDLMDKSTVGIADGYSRKFSRYNIIHQYLTSSLFTSNFWLEVDRVTNGILLVLLPLINMIGEFDRKYSEEDEKALWPELTEVHQKLHNIVAEAAWLANGTSFSRSCFWAEFPRPGQPWDIRQEHVTEVNWKASSQAARDVFEKSPAMRAWYEDRDRSFQEMQATQGFSISLEEWTTTRYLPLYPKPLDPVQRTARVQICMWPFFERYFPHRQNTANGGGHNGGDYAQNVQKAQVVYYSGDSSDLGEQIEDYSLSQHLLDWEKRNTSYVVRFWRAALALLPPWLVACLFWAGFALLLARIAQPGIRSGVDRLKFIHCQSSRPFGRENSVPGYTAHVSYVNIHHPDHHRSRPESLYDIAFQPDGHIEPDGRAGLDAPAITTNVPDVHFGQHTNTAAGDDRSASRDDAPLPKPPLGPEDLIVTVTTTTNERITSPPKTHETKDSTSTETNPHDPRFSVDEISTTITVAHSGPPLKYAYPGYQEEITEIPLLVRPPAPDDRQLSEDLLPDSLTVDELPRVDLQRIPDVRDSDHKTRQEIPRSTRDLESNISSFITNWTWPTLGGRRPPTPLTLVPLEDEESTDSSDYIDGDAGGNKEGQGSREALEDEYGHLTATKVVEDILNVRVPLPETQKKTDQIRKVLEAPLQFWQRYLERDNTRNAGDALEEKPVAHAAQPEDVRERPDTPPVRRGTPMFVRDANKVRLPHTADSTTSIHKDSGEGGGKAVKEEALTGKWVMTKVFGVPYNCWIVGDDATCTQTVTADATTASESGAAWTGDTIIGQQDL